MYELIKRDGMAKRGRLTTVHGTIETPVFMNVGTAAAIKGGVSTDDLRQIKTQVELSNTYHLHVRPGDEVVKKLGGLHKFMNWDKPILTDSGGFQVFSLASLRKIKEEGVHFNSHIDGRKIFMGPEIVEEAMKVLDQVAKVYGHTISYTQLLMGGASIDEVGVPLTEATLAAAKASDAVLMGSIGGDAKTSPWYQLEPSRRPEAGLLQLRKGLNLFANLRPAVLYEELKGACPLKEEIADRGFDLMIMRELTGGLYFGKRSTEEIDGVVTAKDELTYNENEIRRIARRGFDIAMKRRKKVTSVDKANVLDSSRLWRKIVEEVAADYPEVELEHMLVDNCAMQLVKDPAQFDVILTENMFGDILSDEASMVTGSIGMLASASLNDTKFGLYEPSGGSAPDIAGQGIANPIATILSAAMMLRFSFDLDKEADAIEAAVAAVLKDGYRTIDIMSDGRKQIGTAEMGDRICSYIK